MLVDGDVGLGMRRLSIIDLQGGSQPIHNEDGSIRTVFNGEIYNFRELRAELTARGHHFRTGSDTEVIVHAYEEHGLEFAGLLNGMFAIALHDRTRNRLVLARDHLGIKPLYYAVTPTHLVFGSEIKALLASGLVERRLDPESLAEFLAWEYVPGEGTLFRDIRKLEPAHMLVAEGGPPSRPRCFWDVPMPPESKMTAGEWRERVEAQVRQSVRRQMVSDVPLGAFLSGGVDSSLVVAAMGEARTFSIGFADPSYNELGWAQKAAAHLGVQHTDEVIQPEIGGLFTRLVEFLEDPIGDFSIFPTFLVSRLARRHVTVALSGDGGDELFGGYESYRAQALATRYYQRAPALLRQMVLEPAGRALKPRPQKKGLVNKAKRFLEGAAHPASLGHARWRLFAASALQEELLTADVRRQLTRPLSAHIDALFAKAGPREPIARCLYVDLKSYLCDNILTKVDRMSMAVSLEARVPYLDKDLVTLAFQVPDSLKVANGETKILLKEIAARLLPRQCIYRPKEGFSIPIKNWLRQELRPLLEELLSPARVAAGGLFEPACVARLKAEHLGGHANHSHILWTLMIFEAWRRRWLEGGGVAAFSEAAGGQTDAPRN